MSKGGAGKVYFILYLAVVLELLIIIVERDEAEESLRRKQKETMKIVESILSQMQSGSGTEGINTRPQDEITIPPAGVDIKEIMGADIKDWRRYIVEVGVTDVSTQVKRREGENEKEYVQRLKKLVQLGNVEEIEYQIFWNDSEDPNNAPNFTTDKYIEKNKIDFTAWEPGQTIEGTDGSLWQFMGIRKLVLDRETTFNKLDLEIITPSSIHPVYPREMETVVGPSYSPEDLPEDSIFYYSQKQSLKNLSDDGSEDLQKRAFIVNFKPPRDKPGWYKLRFASHTNRILGVRPDQKAEELDDETTVNIGTVQLTVKDLRKVRKELQSKLEKYTLPSYEDLAKTGNFEIFDSGLKEAIQKASTADDAVEIIGKIRLYGYICKLLAPGMSSNFEQNRGSIEFNIRVIAPKVKIADPTVTMPTYTASFDKVPGVFEFVISPYQENNIVEGKVLDLNGNVVSRINCEPLDQLLADASEPTSGGKRDYRGTISETLPPGKYLAEITHKLSGKEKTERGEFEVFKTGLTPESEQRVTNRLRALLYYGYKLGLEAMPTSGGKIKSNQFRIYLKTDADEQKPYINGLSVADEDRLYLRPEADQVSCRITWVQPYSETEVDLYPEKTYPIKQEEPGVILRNASADVTGTAAKLKVTITGVSITMPITGSDASDPEIEIRVGTPEKVDGLKTYDFPIEPTIDGDPETGYIIYLELAGKLERGQTKVQGSVSIPIYAFAVNPVNGKQSEEIRQDYNFRINYEPAGRQSRSRRRR